MNQKKLNQLAIVFSVLALLAPVIFFESLRSFVGNLFFSILIFAVLFVLPLVISYQVITKLTPFIDSRSKSDAKSQKERSYDYDANSENFPVYIRVLIWLAVSVLLSLVWTWLVPHLLVFPTWLGAIARGLGWEDLVSSDNVWQYYWAFVFVIEYLAILLGKSDFEYPRN